MTPPPMPQMAPTTDAEKLTMKYIADWKRVIISLLYSVS